MSVIEQPSNRTTCAGPLKALWLLIATPALAAVSACGGGGGINVGPTPEPSPTNTSLPPTISENFNAASAKIIADVGNTDGAASGVNLASRAAYGTLKVSYDATKDAYTFSDEASSATFLPADRVSSSSAFDTYRFASGTSTQELRLFRSSPSNDRLSLRYVTFGLWSTYQVGASKTRYQTRIAMTGVKTPLADLPKAGTATYTGIADGIAALDGQAYRLAGSTGTLNVDFGTGVVKTEVELVGQTDISSDALGTIALGTIRGTAQIGGDQTRYTGTVRGLGMEGSMGGGFFGPAADETGYAFSLSDGTNTAVGAFVGKKP
ncbi:transferrin-binding protein-like solute binding protein [Novosphingobium cyanobacteriorum]|uniref:Transferrin-binding protein-like solute binding protein n=1 Tax=Novosphingobium cyanobacteriorum TaxID=3024215 RepID=A0ABT6CMQ9_9SPHN|nr:transferrin-binding protein-like solute binding protein [Novosphingobium cyanobacteriorum]MDF8335196.1 transferrin-binding protein-like solute binding protein [Novosphingobium cyanobacteriorum]